MNRALPNLLSRIWLPVLLIAAWWLLSAGTQSLYFPAASDIATEIERTWIFDHAIQDLLPSLRNMLAGFAIGVVTGTLVGTILGSIPRLLDALHPEIEFSRALPGVAILPIAILVLGLGDTMRVFVIALGAMWPVLVNTTYAVRGIDSTTKDVERAFGLSALSKYFRVRLPAVLPQIFAGARVSLYLSVALIVVSEMQGAGKGIGHFVLTAQRNWAVAEMWSGMVILGVVGYGLSVLFRGCERIALRNYPPDNVRKGRS
ncbi:MAG: ABC transporter permease [Hyphomicrobiales bacterium]|nr:MAG: ABC transporter permease [Hyphomicrobiales bacterium]